MGYEQKNNSKYSQHPREGNKRLYVHAPGSRFGAERGATPENDK